MLLYPQRIARLAALAGFLPDLSPERPIPNLTGQQVYIAHGRKDETIPVERARAAAKLLQAAGAEVDTCETEAGHKLPASCFSGLTRFLTD
jgi:predicted esterase